MHALAYSLDGITWNGSANGNSIFGAPEDAGGGQVKTIAWNGSLWIAGGVSSLTLSYVGASASSTDGITWSAIASLDALMPTSVNSVAWNGARWVAGGEGTDVLAYSTNGTSWTASTNGNSIFTTNVTGVAWNGTLWIATGAGTNTVAYSYDGATWVAGTVGAGSAVASRRVLPHVGINLAGGPTGYTGPTGCTGPTGDIGPTGPALPTSIQHGSDTTDGVTFLLAVTFTTPFGSTPTVTATVTGTGAGVITVASVSSTGFTAYTFDPASSGAAASFPFSWVAVL